MEKKGWLVLTVAGVLLTLLAFYILWQTPTVFDVKLAELENEGHQTNLLITSFSEEQAARGEMIFEETTSWSIFKQQIAATKTNLGFVTVQAHREDQVFWITSSETTCYYITIR